MLLELGDNLHAYMYASCTYLFQVHLCTGVVKSIYTKLKLNLLVI